MNSRPYHIREALRHMELTDAKGCPVPFSLEVVTFNTSKGKGGDWLTLNNVILVKHSDETIPRDNVSLTHNPRTAGSGDGTITQNHSKSPNHFLNATRNVKLPNGQIRKINIWLIKSYNGTEVVL